MASDDTAPASKAMPLPPSPHLGAPEGSFDFATHRRRAIDAYEEVRELYDECAQAVRAVLKTALEVEDIRVQSLEARGKSVESFGEKSEKPARADPNKPKYADPVADITDLAGVRVIVFLLDRVDEVGALVEREFDLVEREVVTQESGYRGVHLLVKFSEKRNALPEYRRFAGRVTEIQVRTVLQHAWAEVEHGIVYKSKLDAPDAVRENLADLAGALKVADRGLQDVSAQTTGIPTSAQ
jgi:ppGpp synthetase/RelA/SpoT-type nucleotidyltranferase